VLRITTHTKPKPSIHERILLNLKTKPRIYFDSGLANGSIWDIFKSYS
jgi:hypothetical protein